MSIYTCSFIQNNYFLYENKHEPTMSIIYYKGLEKKSIVFM